ncbi:MAG: hypothetical protein K8R58_09535 [Bacteroidales bacterium]|nr:hypothetical protein [Bacteroidales bacterium]
MKNFGIISFIYLTVFSMVNCSHIEQNLESGNKIFIVKDFNPLANWKNKTKHSKILLDYENAMKGFIIPSINQVEEGVFIFNFLIKNTLTKQQNFYYKIYYQNESYKFPEINKADSTIENEFAHENFYGSWKDVKKQFLITKQIPADNKYHLIENSFCIIGNPRNEKKYYENDINDRWKRNPRVGEYSFLLVVTTKENIINNKIPEYIQDISKKSKDRFVNPYYYYLYGDGTKLLNTMIVKSENFLKVLAKPDLGKGIYINPLQFNKEKYASHFTNCCGQDAELFNNSIFEQFIHYIDISTQLNNIPVISDIFEDNYSKIDYNWNSTFYEKEELISTTSRTAPFPCKSVFSDKKNHKIIIKNLKSNFGNWQKQNVGVISRHGFIYGKHTVKVKLTELLNKENMWNGITNAIWMFTQSQSEWNWRRDCNKEGYLANYWGGDQDKRVKKLGYSEIDFEILKTVLYCPSYQLPPVYNRHIPNQYNINEWNIPFPQEIIDTDDKIVVACTNWDMACWEPSNFNAGCHSITYKNETFEAHRWTNLYRAITEKKLENDDELFGSEYYYFQIDWRPTEIIWRIGPNKDNLRVVGYMNNTITSIPNNQMLIIITQEFHNTKWWIGSQYSQENIPFPKKDIIGEIYELTIE